jgi:hypothetical protein
MHAATNAHEKADDEGGRSEDAKVLIQVPEQSAEPGVEARLPRIFVAAS